MSGFANWISGRTDEERRNAEINAREAVRLAEENRKERIKAQENEKAAIREAAQEACRRQNAEAQIAEKNAENRNLGLLVDEKKKENIELRNETRNQAEEIEKMHDASLTTTRENEDLKRKNEYLEKEKEEQIREEEKLKEFTWGPRREVEWTEKSVGVLTDIVKNSRKDGDGNKIYLKFLVFGPTGHGKSSFCNGVRSGINQGKLPSTYHSVAKSTTTLTSEFSGARYGDHWLIDMPGIFESKDIDDINIQDIASGKVPFYADLTKTLKVKGNLQGNVPEPGEYDVSCVIIVLKYDYEITEEIKRQIDVIIRLGGDGVLAYHLVLTHLDECDPQFNHSENIPNLYKSPKVKSAVKKIYEETGIPPYAISFVKNYVHEKETDINISLLHLRAMESVIFSALEQDDKKRNQEVLKQPNPKRKKKGKVSFVKQLADEDFRRKIPSVQKPGLTFADIKFVVFVLIIGIIVIFLERLLFS